MREEVDRIGDELQDYLKGDLCPVQLKPPPPLRRGCADCKEGAGERLCTNFVSNNWEVINVESFILCRDGKGSIRPGEGVSV